MGKKEKELEEELKESLQQENVDELDPTEHWNKIKLIMLTECENVL